MDKYENVNHSRQEKGTWDRLVLLWKTRNLEARTPIRGVFLHHSTE